MSPREIAIKTCETLSSAGWVDTISLTVRIGLNGVEDRGQVRRILKRLRTLGVLEQRGIGKYFWRLVNKDYDKNNPYSTKSTKPLLAKLIGETEGNDAKTLKDTDNDEEIKIENDPELSRKVAELEVHVALHQNELNILTKTIATLDQARKVEIIIKDQNGKIKSEIKDNVHPIFTRVLFHVGCGDNVMLVGPKGCGKTFLAKQLAKHLGLAHGMLSLSGGVTEGKIFGRTTPNITTGKSEYQSTLFVDLWEGGGLFLWDEIDAADPNVVLSLNGALADGELPLDRPKKPLAKRHKDFVGMAAANTWGNGADRQYVGRNQQDSAFTERFVQLAMDYDKTLELALCPGAEEMVSKLHQYRENMFANRVERTLSTRFITRAYNWLQHGKKVDYIDSMLFAGWREDEVRKSKGGY
jgi:MoxR-like ATPase